MQKNCGKRIVVKIGTGVLTSGIGNIDCAKMDSICKQVAYAKLQGHEVILVSSGAVGLGMGKLKLSARPKKISSIQKCAAVGQGILVEMWAKLFEQMDITVAQILLTKDDVDFKLRHNALKELVDELLADDIIPIINENDCISAAELNIKFGDNDVLSALVSVLSDSDDLIILSTASGLMDFANGSVIIDKVEEITPEIRALASGTSSATAVGGMITKINAAEIATKSGTNVYISSGLNDHSLRDILDGDYVGTKFIATTQAKTRKKKWLANFGKSKAKLYIDDGAIKALRDTGSSLLSAGLVRVSGEFIEGDLVDISSAEEEVLIARGIARISSQDVDELKKLKVVVVHRDNLALI